MYKKKRNAASNMPINNDAADNDNHNDSDKQNDSESGANSVCSGCNKQDDELKLFCDRCELRWHLNCFNVHKYTSMPEAQVWYCDVCSRVDIPHYTAWLPLMPMTYQHGMLQLLSQSHLTYREWINP